MTAAGFEGFPLVLRRFGFVTKHLPAAGGMQKVVYEVQRYLRVHSFPASNASAVSLARGGTGTMAHRVSHYVTKAVPLRTGAYTPSQETKSRSGDLRNPLAPGSNAAMSHAAEMRLKEQENKRLARDEEESVSLFYKRRPYSRTSGRKEARRRAR
jgi:hypothetical protein